MYIQDTIAALSTPPGFGGISVIRMSGDQSLAILKKAFYPTRPIVKWKSHTLYLGWIKEGDDDIDQVMVAWMKKNNSYTNEDIVEISCHGSPILVGKILEILFKHGARAALEGEFTKRAFLNGRIDLSQAESVMELICSKSQKAAQLSVMLLEGKLSRLLIQVKNQLVELVAYIEAFLDFPDEDLPEQDLNDINRRIERVLKLTQTLKMQAKTSSKLRDGIEVAIIGPANAGKSSLFNQILGRERAIVSHHAGTTRDFIDSEFIHKGLLIRFVDTAGLRPDAQDIEKKGQDFSIKKGKNADLILFVVDGSVPIANDIKDMWSDLNLSKSILIRNKMDLPQFNEIFSSDLDGANSSINISAVAGEGVDKIMEYIIKYFEINESNVDDKWLLSQRQEHEVDSIVDSLIVSKEAFDAGLSHEFVASDLRKALSSLEALLGEDLSEAVIDEVFSKFCLGK